MTGFKGQLDDLGVELLGKAIEGLTNTEPGRGRRPRPAVRRRPPRAGPERSPAAGT